MRRKHIPTRTCVGCRNSKPKQELIRIVRTPENEIEVDVTGKKSGRGAYICPSRDCLRGAVQGKQLERALKCPIDQEIIAKLESEING